MATTLFSTRWHRVARLRPQLRPQVQLRRQTQRGTEWYLLVDASTEELRRLNRSAYEFVGRCDGQHTVDQIWQALLQLHPEQVMTQDEALRLMVQLHARRLLQFDTAVDVEVMFAQQRRERRQRRVRRANPLAFQVPLGNPERFLVRMHGLGRALFSVPGLVVWAMLVAWGVLAASVQLPPLMAHGQELLSSTRWMLMAWLLYPLIKLVHETSHGLAVQRWGGAVREAGVNLLVLTPVPYVNASSADAFRHRYQRAVVSAAGVMSELALAALAMLAWQWLQPSLVRDVCLLVMVTGLLSTLLVNGNPLLRFDGYYLLCDALDLRNLASRSSRWWSEFASRRVLGVAPETPLEPLPGERGWLIAYAPLSLVYRVLLSFGIVLWLGGYSALLGAAIGLYLVATMLLWPGWKLLRGVWRTVRHQPRRLWPAGRAAAALVLIAALLFFVPLPFGTVAQGVVWLPEHSQIRAGTDGFVVDLPVADGQRVAQGEVLVRLRDERLDFELAGLVADQAELETRMFRAIAEAPQEAPQLRERLLYVEAEIERVADQQAQLDIRAQVAGTVVMPRAAEQLGRFHAKGELLGHVATQEALVVRVALPQGDAHLVRERSGPIGVRLPGDSLMAHPARLLRDTLAAVSRLPSAALGDAGGGDIVTNAGEPDGLTALQPVVLMDLEVPDIRSPWVGARVAVRFDHGHLPLAGQIARQVRQLVLQRFDALG